MALKIKTLLACGVAVAALPSLAVAAQSRAINVPSEEAAKSNLNPVFSFELRPLLWDDEKFAGKRIVLYRSQDLLRCKKPDAPGMTN